MEDKKLKITITQLRENEDGDWALRFDEGGGASNAPVSKEKLVYWVVEKLLNFVAKEE